jgi:hypothetical protein
LKQEKKEKSNKNMAELKEGPVEKELAFLLRNRQFTYEFNEDEDERPKTPPPPPEE